MNIIAELAVVSIGVGTSLSDYVAVCKRILVEAGLTVQLHVNATNV